MSVAAVGGKKEEALAAFRRAIDDGYRWDWWLLKADATLDSLRDDPRFAAMMKELEEHSPIPR